MKKKNSPTKMKNHFKLSQIKKFLKTNTEILAKNLDNFQTKKILKLLKSKLKSSKTLTPTKWTIFEKKFKKKKKTNLNIISSKKNF
jgi:fibrillarin-like rRNA methylase